MTDSLLPVGGYPLNELNCEFVYASNDDIGSEVYAFRATTPRGETVYVGLPLNQVRVGNAPAPTVTCPSDVFRHEDWFQRNWRDVQNPVKYTVVAHTPAEFGAGLLKLREMGVIIMEKVFDDLRSESRID